MLNKFIYIFGCENCFQRHEYGHVSPRQYSVAKYNYGMTIECKGASN